jgi:hypothetical protein
MWNKLKRPWVFFKRKVKDQQADISDDLKHSSGWYKVGVLVIVLAFVGLIVLGMIWSSEPEAFDVRENAARMAAQYNHDLVPGTTTTATLIAVAETLLDKPGGFLSNDITPPSLWLDNMPHWEYGALNQVRDLSRAMHERFSRSQSQSTEDKDLGFAKTRFHFEDTSWAFPASESVYREGINYLQAYLKRLGDEDLTDAQFFTRADNLNYWFGTVETTLGSLSQRLSASVGQRRLNTDLAGAPTAERSTKVPSEDLIKTPWTEIDDVFYEARGAAWALTQLLRAIEVDFADVLQNKNARVSLQQIIRELEATQEPVFSPVILNGTGFGFVANHSLVMASYISRANAGIIDLRELLSQG